MEKAVYAGSFDPLTNGHLWMIQQGVRLFDALVIAVGSNPDKQYTFSMPDRVAMVEDAVKDLPHICVDSFADQFLVHYAQSTGARYLLRGIRNESDYAYERGMRYINQDLCPHVETVFLMPPREIAEVSSSMVKGLVGPQGWQEIVQKYVPTATYAALLEKFPQ